MLGPLPSQNEGTNKINEKNLFDLLDLSKISNLFDRPHLTKTSNQQYLWNLSILPNLPNLSNPSIAFIASI